MAAFLLTFAVLGTAAADLGRDCGESCPTAELVSDPVLLQTRTSDPSKVKAAILQIRKEMKDSAPVKGLKGKEPFLEKDLPSDANNDLDAFSKNNKYEAPPNVTTKEDKAANLQDSEGEDKDKVARLEEALLQVVRGHRATGREGKDKAESARSASSSRVASMQHQADLMEEALVQVVRAHGHEGKELVQTGASAPIKGLKGKEPFLEKDLPSDANDALDAFSKTSKYEAPPGVTTKEDKAANLQGNSSKAALLEDALLQVVRGHRSTAVHEGTKASHLERARAAAREEALLEEALVKMVRAHHTTGHEGQVKELFLEKDLSSDADDALDAFSKTSKYEAPPGVTTAEDKAANIQGNVTGDEEEASDAGDEDKEASDAGDEDEDKEEAADAGDEGKDKESLIEEIDIDNAPIKGLKGKEPFLDKDLPSDAHDDLDAFSKDSKYEAPPGVTTKEDKAANLQGNVTGDEEAVDAGDEDKDTDEEAADSGDEDKDSDKEAADASDEDKGKTKEAADAGDEEKDSDKEAADAGDEDKDNDKEAADAGDEDKGKDKEAADAGDEDKEAADAGDEDKDNDKEAADAGDEDKDKAANLQGNVTGDENKATNSQGNVTGDEDKAADAGDEDKDNDKAADAGEDKEKAANLQGNVTGDEDKEEAIIKAAEAAMSAAMPALDKKKAVKEAAEDKKAKEWAAELKATEDKAAEKMAAKEAAAKAAFKSTEDTAADVQGNATSEEDQDKAANVQGNTTGHAKKATNGTTLLESSSDGITDEKEDDDAWLKRAIGIASSADVDLSEPEDIRSLVGEDDDEPYVLQEASLLQDENGDKDADMGEQEDLRALVGVGDEYEDGTPQY